MNNNINENKTKKIKNTLVYALGGLEEIGKNTYCIEHDDEIIMIDAGVKFPDAKLLGVDAVIPDYSYLKENNKKIKALLITHGHEDHIGGISYLLSEIDNIPFIYAPRLAAALIRFALKEKKVNTKTIVKEIDQTTKLKFKNFDARFFMVNHSIPDAYGIAINTPNGMIVTTGDYKFDWTSLGNDPDLKTMSELGNNGVKLLMADSTNAEIDGYTLTEKDVIHNIDKIFYNAPGRIIITSFASNVHRIQKIIEIANKHGRKILILGRSIEKIIKIIREIGHLKISDKSFIKNPNKNKINKMKKDLLIICTGSQGEPLAALSKISKGEHKIVEVQKYDTIIFSSSPIPGNKKPVEDVINNLTRLGANILENSPEYPLHTSGHASKEEQKLLFTLLKPKYFMPMHGDYRMLKIHGETANSVNVEKENVFICANGDQINLSNSNAWIGKRINADAIYVDGKDTSGLTTTVVRDREVLSKNGLIAVIFTIDSKNNKLISAPKIISRGSFYINNPNNNKLIASMRKIASETINEVLKTSKPTFSQIKNDLKSSLSSFIFKYKRRNPLIIPVILNKK